MLSRSDGEISVPMDTSAAVCTALLISSGSISEKSVSAAPVLSPTDQNKIDFRAYP